MTEFINKLIERLEYYISHTNEGTEANYAYKKCKEEVNQLAEEYKPCIKSSCSNCEVYDNEKHYCPKWCDVIKGTVAEIEENHSDDFCEWKEKSVDSIKLIREPHRMKLFHIEEERQFCPYCGKKIKVVKHG